MKVDKLTTFLTSVADRVEHGATPEAAVQQVLEQPAFAALSAAQRAGLRDMIALTGGDATVPSLLRTEAAQIAKKNIGLGTAALLKASAITLEGFDALASMTGLPIGPPLMAPGVKHTKTYDCPSVGPIPDDDEKGLPAAIEVSGQGGPIQSLEVAVKVEHPYVGALSITLTPPNGADPVVLHKRTGGSQSGIDLKVPVPAAAGLDPEGTWTLRVVDHDGYSDGGKLTHFGLAITTNKSKPNVPPIIPPSAPAAEGEVVVGSYNVENLFDTKKEPGKWDDQFTPTGKYKWTEAKLAQKLENLGKVFRTINGGKGPDIMALNEVENEPMLQRLRDEALGDLGYETLVHIESDDWRGIDNALISRYPLVGEPVLHQVHDSSNPLWGSDTTRGFLEATLDVDGRPLAVLVTHFPTNKKYEKKQKQRADYARQVRERVEQLEADHPGREVMVLGDFNGNPGDAAFGKDGLRTSGDGDAVSSGKAAMYNALAVMAEQHADPRPGRSFSDLGAIDEVLEESFGRNIGSISWVNDDKETEWHLFDHVLLSASLLSDKGLCHVPGSTQVVREPFMVAEDGQPRAFHEDGVEYGEQKLDRTGYSDHLPVVTRLRLAPEGD